jgi:hypothetical protein
MARSAILGTQERGAQPKHGNHGRKQQLPANAYRGRVARPLEVTRLHKGRHIPSQRPLSAVIAQQTVGRVQTAQLPT